MDTLAARIDRRRALRLLGAALAVPVGLRLGAGAEAATSWCRMDPVLTVDGVAFDVWLDGDPNLNVANSGATGATQLVVRVPVGSKGAVVSKDAGFNGSGYAISFVGDSRLVKD